MEEIAEIRRLAMSTIHGHLLAAIIAGEAVDLHRIVSPAEQNDIAAAFARLGFSNLTGVYESLKERYSYGVLRIYRAINQPKGNEEIVRLEAGSSNPKPS